MRIGNKDLKKAWNMVRSGKYPAAIRYLEPKVPLFLEDELFYYLLGISCFHTGDVGGAEFYFKRSIQVNYESIEARLFLAAILLRKKDQAGAARLWLNILDMDESNRYARKGLDRLKKIITPSDLENYINSKEIFRLVPAMRGILPIVKQIILAVVLFLVLTSALYIYFPGILKSRNAREDMANLSLENYIGPYIIVEGDFKYTMTGEEVRELFDSAVEDFHNYDDNALQMKINKINLSNASEELKSKIAILENLIQQPTFATLKTKYTYREIATDPLMYKNCYVQWSGKVTNINILEDKITLDFLVGYEEEKVLDGIVFVEIPFETSVDESIPLEILGQIRYRNGKIIVTAVSVRPIIK